MSSYHTSFKYLGHNSKEYNLIISNFEPDNGFVDSFLSMESIYDENYDGSKKYSYGAKYTDTANVEITIVKKDYDSLSVLELRNLFKWLTGSKIDSWLDLYNNDNLEYSFLGKITKIEQYKMDAKCVGVRFIFSSVSPWAYSNLQNFQVKFSANPLEIKENNNSISIDEPDGQIIYNDGVVSTSLEFQQNQGLVYLGKGNFYLEYNNTDDIYDYIYVDVKITNKTSSFIEITNETLNETSYVKNLKVNEIINIDSNQFIYSDFPNRIFDTDFNFVFPRLVAGENRIKINASGDGFVDFYYRYPVKIGNCAIDLKEVNC